MRELPEFTELRAAWLNQPEEEIPVDIERINRRRTWALFSTTRSEIISSIGAALFFAGMVAWRFAPERDRLVLFGCAGVIVWAAVTVFRFRNSIRRHTPQPDALARTGLDHYRVELLSGYRRSTRKAWSPGQMLSKTGLLRQHAFRARIRHPVNRNGDHHRLCQGRTPRHCARDRLATAHVSSDPMDATTQPRRFK